MCLSSFRNTQPTPSKLLVKVIVADPGFPKAGASTSEGVHWLTTWQIFAKNCMKMEEIEPRLPSAPPTPDPGSTNVECLLGTSWDYFLNPTQEFSILLKIHGSTTWHVHIVNMLNM